MIVFGQLNYTKARWFHAIFIPVIIEFLLELLSFLVRHEFSEFIESRRNIMDSFFELYTIL